MGELGRSPISLLPRYISLRESMNKSSSPPPDRRHAPPFLLSARDGPCLVRERNVFGMICGKKGRREARGRVLSKVGRLAESALDQLPPVNECLGFSGSGFHPVGRGFPNRSQFVKRAPSIRLAKNLAVGHHLILNGSLPPSRKFALNILPEA